MKPAEIKGEWTTDADGKQVLNVPDSFQDLVEYEYRDKNGNPVPADKLKKGSTYTVSAKIKESEKKNAILFAQDAEGNWNPEETLGSEFKVPGSSSFNSMLGLSDDFPLWQVIVSAVSIILFIIFMIITAKNRKEKKEAEAEIKKYQEDMAEAEEE